MQPWFRDPARYDLSLAVVLSLLLVSTTVGIVEEFATRCVVHRTLALGTRLPGYVVVLFTSLIFSVAHYEGAMGINMLFAFVMSLYIGVIFHLTESIATAIFLHGLSDFVLFLLGGHPRIFDGILTANAQGTTYVGALFLSVALLVVSACLMRTFRGPAVDKLL